MNQVGEEEASEGVVGLLFVAMLIIVVVEIIVFIVGHETWSPLVTPR
jgi:hypothetical protein